MKNQIQVKHWMFGAILGITSGTISYLYFSSSITIVLTIASIYFSNGLLYSNKDLRNTIMGVPTTTKLKFSALLALFSFIMFPIAISDITRMSDRVFNIYLFWLFGFVFCFFGLGAELNTNLKPE